MRLRRYTGPPQAVPKHCQAFAYGIVAEFTDDFTTTSGETVTTEFHKAPCIS